MKKVAFLFLFALAVTSSQAQLRFGAKAGVNYSKIDFKPADPNVTVKDDYGTSFQLGGYVEFMALPKIYIQPGLELAGQTSKVDVGFGEATINLMYLKVPVYLTTRMNMGLGTIYGGLGPYFGYAISGKSESGGVKDDIQFGNDSSDQLKNTDFGLNVMAGYQLKSGLNFTLGYQLGLSDITPKANTADLNEKNRGFSLSLGYSIKL